MIEKIEFDLYVNGAEEQSPQEEQQEEGMPSEVNPAVPNTSIKTAASVSLAISAAKQIGGYVTNNIGRWTGDAKLQRQVKEIEKYSASFMLIAANPVAGSISLALQVGMEAMTMYQDRKWESIESERALKRMGLGSFRNQ